MKYGLLFKIRNFLKMTIIVFSFWKNSSTNIKACYNSGRETAKLDVIPDADDRRHLPQQSSRQDKKSGKRESRVL